MTCTRGAATALLLILAVLVFGGVGSVVGQSSFSFPSDSTPAQNYSILSDGDAYVDFSQKAISMNIRRSMSGASGKSICGRAVHTDKIWMVDKASGTVASFNVSFTFSFKSQNNSSCGDGMVFMFSASPILTTDQQKTAGGAFCVLDYNPNGPNSRLFAVEFDSYYNYDMYDPNDSHIGVDFGDSQIMSLGTHNLCSADTNCSFFCKDENAKFTAWIDYDSAANKLEIRFRDGDMADSRGKPLYPIVNGTYNLSSALLFNALDEEMYVGFIGSTGGAQEVHTIWSWKFVSTGMPNNYSTSGRLSSGLIASICAAVVGALIVAGIVYFCLIHHRERRKEEEKDALEEPPLHAIKVPDDTDSRSYTFMELQSITKEFSELLSSGAFGDVYKGTLPLGALVAVKRIKEDKDQQGQKSFLAEVTSLRQTRHRNLLQLRGWSESADGMFLVYEFMCNKSLDKWLHPNPNEKLDSLSWDVRRLTLAGVASGLEYLHEDGLKCVLHRDIKSSNVMLDIEFKPYLGDFGLARLVDHRVKHKSTLLAGTLGYMAPEMLHTGKATKETDVYAFGILVLEVVCGRRPLDFHAPDAADNMLVDSVWRSHEEGNILRVADPRLNSEVEENEVMMANVLHVGLLCCLSDPNKRPSMRTVNQWFKSSEVAGATSYLPPLPDSKPHHSYSYSLTPLYNSSDGTSSSLTQV